MRSVADCLVCLLQPPASSYELEHAFQSGSKQILGQTDAASIAALSNISPPPPLLHKIVVSVGIFMEWRSLQWPDMKQTLCQPSLINQLNNLNLFYTTQDQVGHP